MAQKLEISLNFDKVLSSLYEEEENFDINPVLYAIKHLDAIKSQVDLYYNTKNLEDSTIQNSYLKIINKIDELWAERVENCANNFEQFQNRLKKILQDSSEITKHCQQKEFLVKIHKIRKESIELRREIFKRNLIFIDKLGKKDIGSLIVIEPFCLDDSQIKIIKSDQDADTFHVLDNLSHNYERLTENINERDLMYQFHRRRIKTDNTCFLNGYIMDIWRFLYIFKQKEKHFELIQNFFGLENQTSSVSLLFDHSDSVHISEITYDAFHSMQNLEIIDLNRSGLESIEALVFRDLVNIKNINLGKNRINSLPVELFRGLKKLEILNISNNRLKSLDSSLDDLENLKKLDISYNMIEKLRPNIFKSLKNLENLEAREIILKVLLRDSLQGLEKLKDLDISHNKIEIIEEGAFSKNCPLLINLDLGLNKLRCIPVDHLCGLKFLKKLILSANSIDNIIPGIFKNMPKIKKLNLSLNNIVMIQARAFEGLDELIELNIFHNKISKFDRSDSFFGLKSLKSLNISFNSIDQINVDIFKYIPNIESLDLSYNKLKSLNSETFQWLDQILELNLSKNNFTDLDKSKLNCLKKFNRVQYLLN